MSVKRRDNKKRILRDGESQRKDGRYMYKYVDVFGKAKYVYSWRLVETDPTPTGKKKDIPLREKEKKIQRDLEDGVDTSGGATPLYNLVKGYIDSKQDIRYNTKRCYLNVLKILSADGFAQKEISAITVQQARAWVVKLQNEGYKRSTINVVGAVLQPAVQVAVDSDMIRKNPFHFSFSKCLHDDTEKMEALTPDEEASLLLFIQSDEWYSRYYDAMYILFKTGLRISEFCGLLPECIDFENNSIVVKWQLSAYSGEYHLVKPKSEKALRSIPMLYEVKERFQLLLERDCNVAVPQFSVDGKTGFLFTTQQGMPYTRCTWSNVFIGVLKKYNKSHAEEIDKLTPHICRHTFCTNMLKSGVSPKTLQYLMGHSNISITLNIYTHYGFDDVQDELEKIGVIV